MEKPSNNKRIAKNTLILYFRTFLLLLVSLYTSRVTLNALGVEDYGLYNVVGGIVAMFSMVSGSLSASISRYITFELGVGNRERLKRMFSNSVTIQLLFSLLVVALAETVGLWFLNNKMVVAPERMLAANWVFQFSIVTFVVNLLSIPYNAAIIAHEKMSAFAFIGLFDGVGKLIIAYFIIQSPIDQLVFYSLALTLLALIERLIYGVYCRKHFEECSFSFAFDADILKKLFGFSGWNFLGASSVVLREQGGNLLLNLFGGPALNAAKVIAMQVNNAVSGFVANFMTALNPQITKSYAAGNTDYMMKLIFLSARVSFYFILLFALPIMFNTETILQLWLGQVPEHSVLFVQLVLLFTMSDCISSPLITAMLATGRVRRYQTVVGCLELMNLPVSYVCLLMGAIPETILIVSIVISQISLAARLIMLRSEIGLSLRAFASEVYLKIVLVGAMSVVCPAAMRFAMEQNIASAALISLVSVAATLGAILMVGCKKEERQFIFSKIKIK